MIIGLPQVGDLITDPSDALRLRVVYRDANHVWLYDITVKGGTFPAQKANGELESALRKGDLSVFREDSIGALQTPGNQKYSKRILKRLAIHPDEIGNLLTEEGRSKKYLALILEDPKLTYKTFLSYLRVYFAAGGAPDAIRSGNETNGRKAAKLGNTISFQAASRACLDQALLLSHTKPEPHPHQLPDSTARGKPRKRGRPIVQTRYLVNDATLTVFGHYYKLLSKPGMRLGKVYDQMCWEVFSVLDPLGKKYQLATDIIPTLKQFKNWYHKLTKFSDKRRNQSSEKDFNTGERELLGNEFSSVGNVGRVGSGDATIWNVGLRDRLTREVIGPAVVFRIRCRKSGMPLGLSVSLEAASWDHFAKALVNCFEDKVEFCARYGIAITADEWPVQGLPAQIEADCGESDNTKANEVCQRVGLTWKNITGGRPDLKGGVESDFNTLQVRMNGETPGALVERWQKTNKSEWRVAAVLDIDQFMTILLRHELDKIKSPRDALHLPSEMVNDGCDSSPLSVWNWHVTKRGGGLRSVDKRRASLAVMERGIASITAAGLIFQGISYIEGSLISDDKFSKARRSGYTSVTVIFDHSLVDNVFLVLPEGGVIHCQINLRMQHQQAFVGMTFREVREHFLLEKKSKERGKRQNRQPHLDALYANKKVVEEAKQLSREAPASKLPNSTQLGNLKNARDVARNAHSPKTAIHAQPAFGALPPLSALPAAASAPAENVIRLKESQINVTGRGFSALMKTVVHTRKAEEDSDEAN